MMDDSANTNIEVNQKAAIGGTTTQIGQQINHYGLTPEQASQMAITMFMGYFPQLRQEALKEVNDIVNRELQKIPQSDIQAPSPKIAVPLLQNASITEEPNLREMYGKLLAGDMNKKLKPLVHPAYIEIINQMSSSDAKLFQYIMKAKRKIPVVEISFFLNGKNLPMLFPHYFCTYFDNFDPWKISVSIENLSRLNLIKLVNGTISNYNYEDIEFSPFVREWIKQNVLPKKHSKERISKQLVKYIIELNDFGRRFASLCL